MVAVLPSSIQPDGIYTPGEAAEFLGIGTTTLWRYAQRGLIRRHTRPGGKTALYTGRDIIRLHRNIVIV